MSSKIGRLGRPPDLRGFLSSSCPLRWGLETWAAIAAISGCGLFALLVLVSAVSFTLPSRRVVVLGVLVALIVGLLGSLATALVAWIVLCPLVWTVRWLAWRIAPGRSATEAG